MTRRAPAIVAIALVACTGGAGVPDAAPDTPDARPGTPDAAPDTPDARPGTPDARPDTPDARPDTPDARPGTPDARTPIPDARPGTPDAGFTPAPHLAFPSLQPGTGKHLDPLVLVTIVAANDSLAAELFAFSDALAGSAWWRTIAAAYGLHATVTSVHHTGAAITANPTQAQMIAYIQQAITDGAPAPNGNTCYLLYLPDGVAISTSLPYSAYHAPFPASGQGLGDGWAVVSRSTPFGGGETQLDELTRVASHEIAEAATDPTWRSDAIAAPSTPVWSGSVWTELQSPGPIEAGDLCEGSRTHETASGLAFDYQRIYSNAAAAAGGDPCIPSVTGPYYAAGPSVEWTAIPAGQTTMIPIVGWSTAPTDDWLVLAVPVEASAGFHAAIDQLLPVSSPLGQELSPCRGEGMNDGVTANVAVTPPAAAGSGDWAVIELESFRVNAATCYPPVGGDQFHLTLLGVYVR
jgi:hypothetical protein